MIKGCKICGVTDSNTLNFIINHRHPPKFIGFICNYPKSPRNVDFESLKKLIDTNKNKSEFVAVLVKPNKEILEKIKNLPFDYYQLYDCSPEEISSIKKNYNIKIITAFTVKDKSDVEKHHLFSDVSDVYLFDSKGYEKSMSFDHDLIKDLNLQKEIMLAGNIQIDDDLENLREIADIIDISGGLETYGSKDISKIDIFLKKIKNIKYET